MYFQLDPQFHFESWSDSKLGNRAIELTKKNAQYPFCTEEETKERFALCAEMELRMERKAL